MSLINQNIIDKLIEAKNVAVLTGAGISAESGIGTFRDPDGLWAKFNPMELASIDGFMSNPNRVWDWYQYRVGIINNALPNDGHKALVEMQSLFPKFDLITQNVDRLHQRAGSTNVIELHGNIVENHCFDCKKEYIDEIQEGIIPYCSHCGGKIRPSVVWFGEMLPEKEIKAAEISANNADVFLTIGTSAEVYPAANLPFIAQDKGAFVIEINPNKTVISQYVDERIEAPAAKALPELLKILKVKK